MLEGRFIWLALEALRLGTSVILDFGLWARDERSALRWLAASAGASCQVVYLPVHRAAQLARIVHRQAHAPHETFAISQAEADTWRAQFEAPDTAELAGDRPARPAAGLAGLARLVRRPLAIASRRLTPGRVGPATSAGPVSYAAIMLDQSTRLPARCLQAGWCFTLTPHRTGCSVAATSLRERSRP